MLHERNTVAQSLYGLIATKKKERLEKKIFFILFKFSVNLNVYITSIYTTNFRFQTALVF